MNGQYILDSIKRKLDILAKSVMSEDEIQKAFTDDELDFIQKAKYIRREGTKGNYKYIYDEPKGGDGRPSTLKNSDSEILEYYQKLHEIELNDPKSDKVKLNAEMDTVSKFSHSGNDTSYIKNLLKNNRSENKEELTQSQKIKMSKEIFEAMDFLKIPKEKFNELKEKHGGIKGLHEYLGEELSGKKKEEPSKKGKQERIKELIAKMSEFSKKMNSAKNEAEYKKIQKEADPFRKELNGLRTGKIEFTGKSIENDIEKGGGKGLTGEKKVAWVMHEFKHGNLKDSHGKVVTDRDQAIAIAMSEAGLSNKSEDEDVEKCSGTKVEKGGNKRDFSTKERENLSEKHEAMPDGSFPIRNEQDLRDAIKSVGRAKDYGKAKEWIKKRAKELGKEDTLPEEWSDKEKAIEPDIEKGRKPMPVGYTKKTSYGTFRKTETGWERVVEKKGAKATEEPEKKTEVETKKEEPKKIAEEPKLDSTDPKTWNDAMLIDKYKKVKENAASGAAKSMSTTYKTIAAATLMEYERRFGKETPKATPPKVEPKKEPVKRDKFSAHSKALSERDELKRQMAALQEKLNKSNAKLKESFQQSLEKMGFTTKSVYQYGDLEKVTSLSFDAGKDYNGSKFIFRKNDYGEAGGEVYLYFKHGDFEQQLGNRFKDLEAVGSWVDKFKKNPSKALDTLEEKLGERSGSVKTIKRNYFTGRKGKGDVERMTPAEIMEKFKIPNVSYQIIQGKRSSVFDRETKHLKDKVEFFNRFKNLYEKYGKPTSIKTESFDSRKDDYEYEAAVRGEREWSAFYGNKVLITFKDPKTGSNQTLQSV